MINFRDNVLIWTMLAMATVAVSSLKAQTVPDGGNTTISGELFKLPFDGPSECLYTSHYDYSALASRLTAGCTDNYSKYKAIYEWICDSIDYDLTHSIHRADSCFLMRKAVCQGYCELFYRIAEAAMLKVELIVGETKDIGGTVSREGHMWLFAYTRENYGILLDPTWGSGSFQEGRYIKNPDKWAWFNVEPEWMLLSHYPDHEHFQLTERHLSREEFLSMPVVNPLFRTYGISTRQLFQMAVEHQLTMPHFYNLGEGIFRLIDIPLIPSLRIGETYLFRVRMNKMREFGIVNQPVLCRKSEWTDEGNGVFSMHFMPRATGRVVFALKNPASDTSWNSMIEYTVEPPTAEDWQKVEREYPLSVPDATKVGNIDAEGWLRSGVDGQSLLALIREQHVEALPSIYHDKGQEFDIISVPINRKLQVGKSYTFSIRPKSGIKWAIVANRSEWFTEWQDDGKGVCTMTVTPKSKGSLELYTLMEDNNNYWTSLVYEVE